MVLLGQNLLNYGKSGCARAKLVVFGQNCCIPAEWLLSGKVVLFGQKVLY